MPVVPEPASHELVKQAAAVEALCPGRAPAAQVPAPATPAPQVADLLEVVDVAVPRASGQPIFTVVAEERGAVRVHAFARRWRAFLYHQERQRPWLAPHDLCASACTGLTSRCVRAMEREGFLCAIRPPAPPAAK